MILLYDPGCFDDIFAGRRRNVAVLIFAFIYGGSTMLDRTTGQSNEDFALMRAAINRALTRTSYYAAGMSVFLGCFIVYGLLGSGYL